MIFRKIITIWMVVSILTFGNSSQVFAMTEIQPLHISAQGAALIDVKSGRILFEKNGDQKMRIASLTKIMTAIVAIENGNLEDMVTTSDNAYGTEGSSIYLKRGEQLTLEDMLYGLMLRSGNDAAVAIAEHIGGSVEGFAFLMNEKAKILGMNHTHFVNPHGLDDKEHYSTPKDMAILTAYALKNSTFKKIVRTKVKTAPLADESWDRQWINKNKLLHMYQWADGVKTGYTKIAKRCLASSATKNGFQLASITLNASDDWNDSMQMLEYGFNNYSPYEITKGTYAGYVKVNKNQVVHLETAHDFFYLLKEDEKQRLRKKVNIQYVNTFVSEQIVGNIQLYLDNQYIGSIPVKIRKEKESWKENILSVFNRWWRGE
ncbi:serine hydrolase [Tepidibacillus infernus]|uniref:serine-type D-Ala-D-Ala carboxypeptidase n=1 Tax=Tepidibacillus decaturensis TaxID=1413211 RepID=A0A135L387_9BACI|nr:D-alanyl-D-alanine carboxypeptidase family protein [Tepidibacillus decaturensis]KXG43357.1 hypothetical protein U473_04515 [Tepidibacillus decaturensis]